MNKKEIILSIILFVLILGQHARAEKLSLQDCIDKALENNREMINAEYGLEVARKEQKSTRGILLPRVDASASYSYSRSDFSRKWEQSIGGNEFVVEEDSESDSESKNSSITLSQSLYNGGKNWSAYSYSKQNTKYSELGYELTQQSIAFAVKQSYFALLKAEELLEVADETLKQSQQYLERARTMYDLGLVSPGDTLKAKVNLSKDKLEKINTENNVSIAQSQLAHILGVDIVAGVEVMPINGEITPEELSLEDYIQIAMENRPEVKQSNVAIKMSEINVRSAWGDRFPSLSAYARYSWSKSEAQDAVDETSTTSWSLGLQLDMNIFDGLSTESNIQKSKINLKKAKNQLEQVEQDIILEVKEAYLNIVKAYQKIEVSQEEVSSAQEDLRLMEQKYDLGKSSFIDLSDAQLGLTLAKSHYIQSVYDYHLAKAALAKAVGLDESIK
jgi:TolC family type I secretion outer membrane protein